MSEVIRDKQMRIYLFGFLLAVIVGIASSKYTILAFGMVAICLFITALIFNKQDFLFNCAVVGLFVVPFSNYNFFKVVIPIPSFSIDIFSLLFYFLTILIILKQLLTKQKVYFDKSYILLLGVIIFYLFVGILKHDFFVKWDIKIFLLYVVYGLGLVFYNKKDNLKSFIKILLISSLLLSVLVILMYFFKDTIFSRMYTDSYDAQSTRVGTGNQSFFIIGIPLLMTSLHLKLLNGRWKLLTRITIFLSIISVIFTETRVLIISVLINVVLTFLINTFKDKRLSFSLKYVKVLFAMLLIICGILLLSMTPIVESGKIQSLISRFSEWTNSGTSLSEQRRIVSNQNAEYLIKRNLFGYGIGAQMAQLDWNGSLISSQSFIDNSFLSIIYKLGIPGFLVFCLFYLKNFFKIFKISKNDAKSDMGKMAITIIICLPFFIVNCVVYTSHFAFNGAVFSFILIIFALFNQYDRKKKCN